jgi:uncharacterized protein (TIGR02594 family)
MRITAFERAQRFVGAVYEIVGESDHPLIRWWLSLCALGLQAHDEIPWCSAFVNGVAWDLRLPRSKSAAARSWLTIGRAVSLEEAQPGWDVVILKRGAGEQPGPEVIAAPGHVGFYAGREGGWLLVLGGNQGNAVSVARFSVQDLLGVRRLMEVA